MDSDFPLTFEDCAELVSNKIHPKDVAQDTPYIGLEHIVENGLFLNGMGLASDVDSQKSVFKKGDILFGKLRPYFRKVVIAPCNGICSTDIWVVRPKEHTDINFLFYWMASKQFVDDVTRASEGTRMPRAKWEIAAKFKKPKSENEKEIGFKLRILDKKIAINRQINQTLEAIAQSIFKSWFIDFEPVKAKIAAIEAGEDTKGVTRAAMSAISGKTGEELDQLQAEQPEYYTELKTTAELFPFTMQASELGEVPDGWEISIIGDEVVVVGGGTPSTKNHDFWDGGEIHWTTPKDLSNLSDKILLTTDRKITVDGLKNISSGLLPVNTVLMSSRAPVGYLALAKIPVAVNQGYIALICEKRLSPEFVIQWCNSVMDMIKQRSSGTTFDEINKKNFKVIPVIVPIKEIQQFYSKLVSGLYDKIAETAMESKTLTDIRDSLLPKLLSGELLIEASR